MLSVRVGSTWLDQLGAPSQVRMTHGYPYGPLAASWVMDRRLVGHPALLPGQQVRLYAAGVPVWRGRLSEPSPEGAFAAEGPWREADQAPALDGSGDSTTNPVTAIDAAIAAGDVTWTGRVSGSWTDASLSEDDTATSMTLLELLTAAAAKSGRRWWINLDGTVETGVDPTVPTLQVRDDVTRGLSLAEDDFYTHLTARFLDSTTSAFAAVSVGDADAAALWGRRRGVMDLDEMGPLTSAQATSIAAGKLALVGARMGWSDTLTLSAGQVLTTTGVAVPLHAVTARQVLRLPGVYDRSRPHVMAASTDVVIGESTWSAEEATVQVKPLGLAARNLGDMVAGGRQ